MADGVEVTGTSIDATNEAGEATVLAVDGAEAIRSPPDAATVPDESTVVTTD